ncbi:glucosaminidase domain-containing protein [Flammeovirgaceae bacterium SG7u.111]|nr:glucosaminidase domain-containing protein [Flammeovirgaceae bacterium SG7u.132]WPO33445.1 glucosaminidase domain-containing protein [Flammeovirgaceae bacterium SG7u.111]
MKKGFLFLLLISLLAKLSFSQSITPDQYIDRYKNAAVQSMHQNHIPASIILAQGILESGNGNSKLAQKGNNHFGIKCHDWTGPTIKIDDDRRNECFRKYSSVLDSYNDHALFLSSRDRYSSLFTLQLTDYKGWAKGLKKAGYATSPTYAKKLIDIIERYRLYEYDTANPSDYPVANNRPLIASTSAGAAGTAAVGGGVFASRAQDVFSINKKKCIKVMAGETKNSLALSLDIKVSKIENYNELGKGDKLKPGQVIFLEAKKSKAAKGNDYHTVKPGDSFYSISQKYGIQMEALLKKNNMWYGSELIPGDKLYLRKTKPLAGI